MPPAVKCPVMAAMIGLHDRAHPLVERILDEGQDVHSSRCLDLGGLLQIHAGAEGAAIGAGENDGANVVAPIDFLPNLVEAVGRGN